VNDSRAALRDRAPDGEGLIAEFRAGFGGADYGDDFRHD